jgi:hypothetical protein
VGDLVNVTGTQSADASTVIVDDPAALVRVSALGGSMSPEATRGHVARPQPADQQVAPSAQMAPIVAFTVIFGLSVAVAIGAFAVKLYGPNRVKNWPKRLKARFVRI